MQISPTLRARIVEQHKNGLDPNGNPVKLKGLGGLHLALTAENEGFIVVANFMLANGDRVYLVRKMG